MTTCTCGLLRARTACARGTTPRLTTRVCLGLCTSTPIFPIPTHVPAAIPSMAWSTFPTSACGVICVFPVYVCVHVQSICFNSRFTLLYSGIIMTSLFAAVIFSSRKIIQLSSLPQLSLRVFTACHCVISRQSLFPTWLGHQVHSQLQVVLCASQCQVCPGDVANGKFVMVAERRVKDL